MKKLRTLLAALTLAFSFTLVPAAVSAQSTNTDIQGNLCKGANLDVNGNCPATDGTTAGTSINNLIRTVINILSIVVGVVAVIMIIIGGLRYIISGGDSGNVTAAKNTILYALVGLVIVALAQIIVRFVLGNVTT